MPPFNPANYSRQSGGARRYVNKRTGATISRRQYLNKLRGETVEQYRAERILTTGDYEKRFPQRFEVALHDYMMKHHISEKQARKSPRFAELFRDLHSGKEPKITSALKSLGRNESGLDWYMSAQRIRGDTPSSNYLSPR